MMDKPKEIYLPEFIQNKDISSIKNDKFNIKYIRADWAEGRIKELLDNSNDDHKLILEQGKRIKELENLISDQNTPTYSRIEQLEEEFREKHKRVEELEEELKVLKPTANYSNVDESTIGDHLPEGCLTEWDETVCGSCQHLNTEQVAHPGGGMSTVDKNRCELGFWEDNF